MILPPVRLPCVRRLSQALSNVLRFAEVDRLWSVIRPYAESDEERLQ